MRLRLFSKGRISEEIPPDLAVTQHFEVPASPERAHPRDGGQEPQNVGPAPPHSIDAALRKGAWPQVSLRDLVRGIPFLNHGFHDLFFFNPRYETSYHAD
jgi:hypothetical protein